MKFFKALLMASFFNVLLFSDKVAAEHIFDFIFENTSSQVVKVAVLMCHPAPRSEDTSYGWSSYICDIKGWYLFQPHEASNLVYADQYTKPNYQVVTSIWLSLSAQGRSIPLSSGKTRAIKSCSYRGNPDNSYYCDGIRTTQSVAESIMGGFPVTFYETGLIGTGILRFTYTGRTITSQP